MVARSRKVCDARERRYPVKLAGWAGGRTDTYRPVAVHKKAQQIGGVSLTHYEHHDAQLRAHVRWLKLPLTGMMVARSIPLLNKA